MKTFCVVLALVAIITILLLFWMFFVFVLSAACLAWICGAKIKITKNGRPYGYIRWTKFHKA